MSRLSATQLIERRARALLGDDTVTLGKTAGAQVKVKLAKDAFAPGSLLELTDLEEADFGGYAPLEASDKPAQVNDPATTDALLILAEPIGGWTFLASGTPVTNAPQTIYGYFVVDETGTTLYGAQLLDAPVVIQSAFDFVSIGRIEIRFPAGYLS